MNFNTGAKPMPEYPGLVSRQDLVDLCRGELPRLVKENELFAENIDLFERQHGDHRATIQSFNLGLAENIGFQKALRMVCEWAKDHLVEEPAIGDPEDEIADYRKQLKDKFGASDH
ncbi:hypothetical protein MADRUGA_95 [Mycobacterium phage Madruga]|uniref:Uncharacterized protein n=1 Tax=Mycobacterium phage Madruga TaxID=1675552 RepID=A0A0K1LSD1_9CAUD|nr:hypothetical protein MADRUGA_95 [Mycobacterium phage Madruga]